MRECNWLQGLEGDIDTSHAGILHGGADKPEMVAPVSAVMDVSAMTVPVKTELVPRVAELPTCQ